MTAMKIQVELNAEELVAFMREYKEPSGVIKALLEAIKPAVQQWILEMLSEKQEE